MATAAVSFQQTSTEERLARSIWYLGALMTIHADGKDTDGRFALVEAAGGPGGEPPLHVHQNEDELVYVLEGKLKIFRGGQELILNPGDSAFLPRNVPHTFKILSTFARTLVYISPAGFENFFREIGRPAEALRPPKVVARPDFEKIAKTLVRYGGKILA
jgi:quercetin dioxygenase-like cupin family protein